MCNFHISKNVKQQNPTPKRVWTKLMNESSLNNITQIFLIGIANQLCILHTILQNKMMWWRKAAPHQTFLSKKTNQGKLCIILKRIYGRFRISLNNCELQNFASLSQKSSLGENCQNFKVFILIKYYKIRINHIRPPAFKILCTQL